MEFKSVSKNCVKEWYIIRTIAFLIFSGIFVFFLFIPANERFQIIAKTTFLIFWAMIVLIIAVNAFIFPKMQYNRLKYRIDSLRIEKHSGVVFLRKISVPFVRIQHTEIYRGILDRVFKMATVIIFTAGSAVRITNLDVEQADDLIAHIRKLIAETEGESAND